MSVDETVGTYEEGEALGCPTCAAGEPHVCPFLHAAALPPPFRDRVLAHLAQVVEPIPSICMWDGCADELQPSSEGMSQVFCDGHLWSFWLARYRCNPNVLIARARTGGRARLGSLVAS